MKIIGVLFIAFGLLDMIGSWTGLDVWSDWLQVELPEAIWQFSAYIEIAIGYLLMKLGSKGDSAEEDAAPPSEE